MTQTFGDAGRCRKGFLDSGFESLTAMRLDAQAIANEASNYAKSVFEACAAAAEKLASAKSVVMVVEIQTAYAKQAYESFVAEATKMGELYADMAKDAYRPFERIVAKAK